MTHPVPLLLVTGALGAGKTTLINRLLGQADPGSLAAIVNDFGAIDIDAALLAEGGRPVWGLRNGCICCSLQGDLLRTLRTVLKAGPPPTAIVIEASGAADPRGIIVSLLDPVLAGAVRLDSVTTVVDAEAHAPGDPLWQAQLAAADFVVMTRTGGLSGTERSRLSDHLGGGARVVLDAAEELRLDVLFGTEQGSAASRQPPADGVLQSVPHAAARFNTLEWRHPQPLEPGRFRRAMERISPGLVRAKGFLALSGQPTGMVLQMVGRRASLTPWPHPLEGSSLVLIGEPPAFDAERARAVLDDMTQEAAPHG